LITTGESESKIIEIIKKIQQTVGQDNVYLEVTAQEHKVQPALEKINAMIIKLAESLTIKCIVNNNYFHVLKKDRKAREAALAIKDNMKLYDPMRRKPAGKYHIMTADEIIDICKANGYSEEQITKRLETNLTIAESIETKIQLGNTYFPNYDPPEDIIQMYEKYKDVLVE
jgi:DNA polymerase-3 subunit alpha